MKYGLVDEQYLKRLVSQLFGYNRREIIVEPGVIDIGITNESGGVSTKVNRLGLFYGELLFKEFCDITPRFVDKSGSIFVNNQVSDFILLNEILMTNIPEGEEARIIMIGQRIIVPGSKEYEIRFTQE